MLTSRGETIRETRWDMYERVDQLICEAQSFFRSSDAQGMQSEGDVLSLLSRSENIYSQQTDHLFYGTQYDPLTFFDADSYPTLRLDNWKITPLISGELHLVTSNGFFV